MKYHAHFDCFSGAAGDMMLAACIDAADAPEELVDRVVRDLEGGLPELRGEFELSTKIVWRGMGRIAARKVDIDSVYGHEAAPVPGARADAADEAPSPDHVHQHLHDTESGDKGAKGDPQSHGGAHAHSHGHSHSHSNDHGHSAHSHSHDHDRMHSVGSVAPSSPLIHSHDHSHGHSHEHSHEHSHDHQRAGKLRNLPQIARMLRSAPSEHIPPRVAHLAVEAFTALAHAERHTHGAASIDEVHFHEVGAVDSIVDTVGTLLALHHLGVRLGDVGDAPSNCAVSCSPLPLGEGTVWTDHGLLPVPAPAALRLMIGMPTCPGPRGVTGELVTPTAAALLRALTVRPSSGPDGGGDGTRWRPRPVPGRPPALVPRAVGIGAGSKDFERHPNILRLILGDEFEHGGSQHACCGSDAPLGEEAGDGSRMEKNKKVSEFSGAGTGGGEVSGVTSKSRDTAGDEDGRKQTPQLWDTHTLTHIEANIDDCTPELLAHSVDLLLKNGAIDAWVNPIVMKKGRPAHSLNAVILADASAESHLLTVVFRHTTTLGIRIHRDIHRAALERRFVEVQLPYTDNGRDGRVDVKIGFFKDGEVTSVKAEFDQCLAVSRESGAPLKEVSRAAERLARDAHVRDGKWVDR